MLYTLGDDLSRFYDVNRQWQGIPGIEITKNGRIFSTFYSGGKTEEPGNYCVILISDDDGKTFSEPICAAYDGETERCYDPCLWMDPLGRLWFIWASTFPELGVYRSICENPDADTLHWSKPILFAHDVMLNKPTVLASGDWLFPCAVWNKGVVTGGMKNNDRIPQLAYVYRSRDQGKTFQQLGGANADHRSFDEHMIVELADGKLAMYIRTTYGIAVSYSTDKGKTWSYGVDSGIWGPNSRFFIRRLPSGHLLLVNHLKPDQEVPNRPAFAPRNRLAAMISKDDGKNWEGLLMLDEREGVSYPDGTGLREGFLYVTYDRERYKAKEILFAKFTEEDVLASRLINPASRLKNIINRL